MEKFRLQYCNFFKDALLIQAEGEGACRVRAIQERTSIQKQNKRASQNVAYSEPMSTSEAKDYISKNIHLLGEGIERCIGLKLEDVCKEIDFN